MSQLPFFKYRSGATISTFAQHRSQKSNFHISMSAFEIRGNPSWQEKIREVQAMAHPYARQYRPEGSSARARARHWKIGPPQSMGRLGGGGKVKCRYLDLAPCARGRISEFERHCACENGDVARVRLQNSTMQTAMLVQMKDAEADVAKELDKVAMEALGEDGL